MIHPSYNELLKTLNEVRDENEPEIDSRYSLVIASAKRARQIVNGQEPLADHVSTYKPLSIAVSLGCDKNLVDTEKMLGILADEGCTFTDDEAQAQVIIVNTCCFIGDAKEESIQNILDLARFKTEGKLEALIATGCLSQRYQDEMLEELPELDGILGISAWHTIADVVREALEGKRPRNLMSTGVLNSHTTKRLLTTGVLRNSICARCLCQRTDGGT